MLILKVLYSLQHQMTLFFFNSSFVWLRSVGTSDKDDGDKHEGGCLWKHGER